MRWPTRVLSTGGIAVAAWLMPSAAIAAVTVRLGTPTPIVAPGDTVTIEFVVPVADSAFNAFHLVLSYDPTLVTFVPTVPLSDQVGTVMSDACPTLFHQFRTLVGSNTDSTVADVSLLCNQTFATGPGVIYRQKFLAGPSAGVAVFSIGVSSHVYAAGVFVNPLHARGLTLVIGNVAEVPQPRHADGGCRLEAPRPNPLRLGEDATVAFTLPDRAAVALELFDLGGRRVAARDVGLAPAGPSTIRWALPSLPAGHYQLRLRADGQTVARTTWVMLR